MTDAADKDNVIPFPRADQADVPLDPPPEKVAPRRWVPWAAKVKAE